MDSNRVQSYIKSHVLPKLESLPQDVQSVKNAFDAWKADWTQARAIKLDNLDAKVSTRATAADMGTALERINTNITETVEVKGKLPFKADGTTTKLISASTAGEMVNITGKGALYLAGIGSKTGDRTRTVTINVDDTVYTIKDANGWSTNTEKGFWTGYVSVDSCFFLEYCTGMKIDRQGVGYNAKNVVDVYGLGNTPDPSARCAVSRTPIVFEERLTITINNPGNCGFLALYELEG